LIIEGIYQPENRAVNIIYIEISDKELAILKINREVLLSRYSLGPVRFLEYLAALCNECEKQGVEVKMK